MGGREEREKGKREKKEEWRGGRKNKRTNMKWGKRESRSLKKKEEEEDRKDRMKKNWMNGIGKSEAREREMEGGKGMEREIELGNVKTRE